MRPSLASLLQDPGFTPGAGDFSELFDALARAERDAADQLERVLARSGIGAALAARSRIETAGARERARLVAVIGRVLSSSVDPELAETGLTQVLYDSLEAGDEHVRRAAIRALGKLDLPETERRLLALFPTAGPAERRALTDALGKVGSAAALALLQGVRSDDPELTRRLGRATLMLERTRDRSTESLIALDKPLPASMRVVLRCRGGLSQMLAEEAQSLSLSRTEVRDPDEVHIDWSGTLAELFRVRIATDFCIEVACSSAGDLESAVVEALLAPPSECALRAWTRGAPRFRLTFAEGGHRRASVLQIARRIRERCDWLRNDPRGAAWDVLVDRAHARLLLCPKAFADPRFSYRTQAVHAASHPTLAAALARRAGVRDEDVIWDPFVGSGLELAERARLGPYRALHGSDIDPAALDATRANLHGAGVKGALLAQGDALTHSVPGVTLIITNPPMGRRVARDGSLARLLEAFVERASHMLVRSGRLVWLSPLPERTARRARECGFSVERGPVIDMRGFSVELQRFQR